MKNKKKVNVKKIISVVLLVLLTLFWLTCIVMAVFGAYFPTIAEPIEDFLELTGDENLLDTSVLWLVITTVVTVFLLLFKDFKKKYID